MLDTSGNTQVIHIQELLLALKEFIVQLIKTIHDGKITGILGLCS